ncbi:putative membrane protein [Wenyingzhuangia heitensis]|uniref:Membrane protein n=1 Tax=Wenyingzhuangia heitensis TaxID=1487859 RepID=A0ABX0UFB5_9FLAO|nr:SdpI family protein [Wenyingzhuangia heitensis]NIJ46565.1 putative membrane protein [Wenyingzhuangia heitensis]
MPFITPYAISIISILMGVIMLKFPPKHINMFYGYRTKQSMSSIFNWNFAQKYSAKKMIQIGGILLLICIIGSMLKIPERNYKIVIVTGIVIGVISLILVLPITEYKLKHLKK